MTSTLDPVNRWLSGLGGSSGEGMWNYFVENWHADATWWVLGDTPLSGLHQGLDRIQEDFLYKCFRGDGRPNSDNGLDPETPVTMVVDEVVEITDGRVLVICHATGALGKGGVPYENTYAWVIEVRDDKIASLREWTDTAVIEKSIFDKVIVGRETVHAQSVVS